jgi:hypothetical protein
MKKKDALVFILGPITPTGRLGLSPVWELVWNLRAFFLAESSLIREDVAVINPAADIFALFASPDGFSEKSAKEKSIDKLSHCNIALALPGWERSEGAMAEKEKADKLGIPVFYNIGTLLEALQVDDIMCHIYDYLNSGQKIMSSGRKIGEAICGAVRDIIPDIDCRVENHFENLGKFWFSSKTIRLTFEDTKENISGWEPFYTLVSKVFPELEDYIADDMMYIPPDTQAKIIRRLEMLRPAGK